MEEVKYVINWSGGEYEPGSSGISYIELNRNSPEASDFEVSYKGRKVTNCIKAVFRGVELEFAEENEKLLNEKNHITNWREVIENGKFD